MGTETSLMPRLLLFVKNKSNLIKQNYMENQMLENGNYYIVVQLSSALNLYRLSILMC